MTAHAIDDEIRNIINRNYARAEQILREKIDILHKMAAALMKYETIDADQINDLMEGREPRPPQDWDESQSSGGNRSSGSRPADGAIGGPAGQH
jgi:cell division protease FtsH